MNMLLFFLNIHFLLDHVLSQHIHFLKMRTLLLFIFLQKDYLLLYFDWQSTSTNGNGKSFMTKDLFITLIQI